MSATVQRQTPRYSRYLVRRVAMCGGGTSYDVFVPAAEVAEWRIMTRVAMGDFSHYWVRYPEATLPERHNAIPLGWDRLASFNRHEKAAQRAMLRIARRVCPELCRESEWPTLWTGEDHPSAEFTITREV